MPFPNGWQADCYLPPACASELHQAMVGLYIYIHICICFYILFCRSYFFLEVQPFALYARKINVIFTAALTRAPSAIVTTLASLMGLLPEPV